MCFYARNENYEVFNILAKCKKKVGAKYDGTYICNRPFNLPINRTRHIKETIESELQKRGKDNLTFEVISDPNFLKG